MQWINWKAGQPSEWNLQKWKRLPKLSAKGTESISEIWRNGCLEQKH